MDPYSTRREHIPLHSEKSVVTSTKEPLKSIGSGFLTFSGLSKGTTDMQQTGLLSTR